MSKMFAQAKSAFTKPKEGEAEQDGESLTTVLESEEDRSALTILIADCTEAMRQAIIDVFDAKETGKKEDLIAKVEGESPEQAEKDKEKLDKELAKREKELNEEKLQEIKKAALEHFDAWRSSVIERVGEVVNSRETASKHKHHGSSKKEESEEKQDKDAVSPMKFQDLPKYDEEVQHTVMKLYPPVENPLRQLPEDRRALILHSLLLLLLSLEHYHAESRVLLLRMSTSLHLPIDYLANDESKVARVLLTAAENMNADEETKKAADENKVGRRWKVGLATAAGAALIGITGGLAAPLLAAGIGTVMGGLGLASTAAAGYLGALAGSSVLVGGLFGAYGGRMTGKMMDQYAKQVEDFAFIPIRDHHKPRKIEKEYRRLRVAVGISGWITQQDEVLDPWKVLGAQMESFALQWELEALMNLGNALTTMVTSAAWGFAKTAIIKSTVLGALSAGLWPLGLLKVSRLIDNPFSVANYRAQKAGDVLADALINKAQGERPLTLIGYSLGGKVIFTCLQRLAERKAFGLIENVVLIGTPAPSSAAEWRLIRSVVTGRVVNVYSAKDYVLGFLYRSHSIQLGVAGLQAVENVKGVENKDVSEFVSGHTTYRNLTGRILKEIGFEDVDESGLEEEEEQRKMQEAKEEAERVQAESEENEKQGKKDDKDGVSDEYVTEMEQKIEKKNEQSYVGWMQEKMQATGTGAKAAYEKAKAQWQSRRPNSSTGVSASATAGGAAGFVPTPSVI